MGMLVYFEFGLKNIPKRFSQTNSENYQLQHPIDFVAGGIRVGNTFNLRFW
jgi:hypothetical protein